MSDLVPPVEISTASPADLLTNGRQVTQLYVDEIHGGGDQADLLDTRYLFTPNRVTVIARRAGKLIGATTLDTSISDEGGVNYAEISETAVIPDERGNGVGTQMLGLAEHEARIAGNDILRVYAASERNHNLYVGAGFHPVGEMGADGDVMFEKPLTPVDD